MKNLKKLDENKEMKKILYTDELGFKIIKRKIGEDISIFNCIFFLTDEYTKPGYYGIHIHILDEMTLDTYVYELKSIYIEIKEIKKIGKN